jgi:hypothetical protein
MPYINRNKRLEIDRCLQDLALNDVGELNYVFTKVCLEYLKEQGMCYETLNGVVGALESAKLEFYRRMVSDYEDKKCICNGDIEGYSKKE